MSIGIVDEICAITIEQRKDAELLESLHGLGLFADAGSLADLLAQKGYSCEVSGGRLAIGATHLDAVVDDEIEFLVSLMGYAESGSVLRLTTESGDTGLLVADGGHVYAFGCIDHRGLASLESRRKRKRAVQELATSAESTKASFAPFWLSLAVEYGELLAAGHLKEARRKSTKPKKRRSLVTSLWLMKDLFEKPDPKTDAVQQEEERKKLVELLGQWLDEVRQMDDTGDA